MHWQDEAIVLTSKKHGESNAVSRMFTRQHGVFAGVVRAASSKTNRGIVTPGNVVAASWNARLSEHLGSFKAELLMPHAAHIMADGMRLSALTSACALMEAALPERHPYPKLYDKFIKFLNNLSNSTLWQQSYVELEMAILAESGFGLDLGSCAATGVREDLIYVSPRSGRSVCREAGAPYAEKMLPLPAFLLAPAQKDLPQNAEILAGLRLSGYFLDLWLLEPHGKKLPAARQRLTNYLKEKHGEVQTTAA